MRTCYLLDLSTRWYSLFSYFVPLLFVPSSFYLLQTNEIFLSVSLIIFLRHERIGTIAVDTIFLLSSNIFQLYNSRSAFWSFQTTTVHILEFFFYFFMNSICSARLHRSNMFSIFFPYCSNKK